MGKFDKREFRYSFNERSVEMAKNLSVVQGLRLAGNRAGGDDDDRTQGQGEHHGPVVAHDDGVRAAAGGMRDQRAQPQLRRAGGDEGVRAQHPVGGAGEAGGGRGQLFGQQGGQVQQVQADGDACGRSGRTADRRMFRQSRMQGGRCADGEQVQFLRAGSGQGWIDPARKNSRTLHHRGRGVFMVAGDTIKLPSGMA